MTVFSVSYDLNNPGQKYEALYRELQKTEHLHHLDSNWLISTNETAENLCSRLRKHLDDNDSLLIIKVTRPITAGSRRLRGTGLLHMLPERKRHESEA